MDFKDEIKNLSDRHLKIKNQLLTEEATKNSIIMPFIKLLGYDPFDPDQVTPEFTADYGTKKAEKVDYALIFQGKPIILIECKKVGENLDISHESQLYRYFSVTKTRFGILTNGTIWQFFSDIDEPNIMDKTPFLEFDLSNISEHLVEELKKFHKSYFNLEASVEAASELKYTSRLKQILLNELKSPSVDFVKFFSKQIYDKVLTEVRLKSFTEIVKKSLTHFVGELINERLKAAAILADSQIIIESINPLAQTQSSASANEEKNKIVTTEEEKESFWIIRSILRVKIDPKRIFYRDAQTYFSILLDDNNRKSICRLYLNADKKYIGIFNNEKKETKYEIHSVEDIYNFSEHLIPVIEMYEKETVH